MDAAENIFGDHYGKSVVSPARFSFPICRISTKKCFRSCGASVIEMLFKLSCDLFFSKYHDCKRRTEVLVLFFVFSEDMSSLKVFISSSVYVTIDPGTCSAVFSPSCLVELLLAIFCALFTGFFCFLVVASERGFLCLSKNL